jgi:uncharacterized glyoxalase superfamily protein PhnB
MTIRELTPTLRTWDFAGSLAFYTEALGFVCVAHEPEYEWASLRRDAVALMLSGPNAHLPERSPAFTGSLYLRVDDVETWWRALKDKARVCYPIESFDYGMREFAIYDNNGYLLQFGQPIGDDSGTENQA